MKRPDTTKEDEGSIKWMRAKRETLEQQHNRRNLVAQARYELHIVDKAPGNVIPLTKAEYNLLLTLSYQSFDWLYKLAADGSEEELRGHVANPETWRKDLEDVLLAAAYAVPIYLDAGPGKIAVAVEQLDERNQRESCPQLAQN